jgi:hypothetical protein
MIKAPAKPPPTLAQLLRQFIAQPSYLERLFHNARRGLGEKSGGKLRLNDKVKRTVRSSLPRKLRLTLKGPEQMRYRQSLIAHQILTRYEGTPMTGAHDKAQRIPSKGPWRTYELSRLEVRILSERFDKSKDTKLLPEYRRAAVRAANSKFANFEDFLYAGHACLYNKEVNKAEDYLLRAWKHWPPVTDDMSGFVYTFLTCIAGIRNNSEATLKRMKGFQAEFPDWLYSEIYLPEFEFLEKTYPDSPLIKVFHGRVLSLVSNDAKALAKYTEALRHPSLDRLARKQVAIWIREIRLSRKKGKG